MPPGRTALIPLVAEGEFATGHGQGYPAAAATNRSTPRVGPTAMTSDLETSQANVGAAQAAGSGVLVAYEASASGRAALVHAAELARAHRIALTVLSVTPQERADFGCARCRQSAAMWNVEMADLAHENLLDAAELLERVGLATIDYVVGRGDPATSIAAAAARAGADLVVVPWKRLRILGVYRRRTLAARLDTDTDLTVRCGPAPSTTAQTTDAVDQPSATPPAAHREWRQLAYAIAFFCACLAVLVTLFAIGFYH